MAIELGRSITAASNPFGYLGDIVLGGEPMARREIDAPNGSHIDLSALRTAGINTLYITLTTSHGRLLEFIATQGLGAERRGTDPKAPIDLAKNDVRLYRLARYVEHAVG